MRRKNYLIILLCLVLYIANIGQLWADSGLAGNQQYYSALTDAINEAIASIYHTKITLIEYPSQGDFKWYYKNLNGVFNEGTFDYISARIIPGKVPGTAQLSSAGGFPNAYDQVVTTIIFTLSTKDTVWLYEAQNKASTQAITIVDDYEATFGKITDADMDNAAQKYGKWAVGNKFDYIITVIIGSQWSGRAPPLTYTQIALGDLKKLLPNAPIGAERVIADVQCYLDMMKPINSLLSKAQQGSWVISQLKNNVRYPSDATGGMKTVNPNTGAVSQGFQLGYTIMRPLSDIQNDLNNKERILRVEIPPTPFSILPDAIDGSVLWFPRINSPAYDMNTVLGGSYDSSIVLEYQGYTMVPIAPCVWNEITNTGWYFKTPIAEAYANGKQDVTGFKFVVEPAYKLGPLSAGGNFGYITNLLICKYPPKITINYRNADLTKFKKSWDQKANGNLTLLGNINIGYCSEYIYSSKITPGYSNSNFSVIFSSPQENTMVPLLQSTAYVIGGTFEFPANK